MWKEIDKTKGPIYRQMMDQIMKNIENGNLAPGKDCLLRGNWRLLLGRIGQQWYVRWMNYGIWEFLLVDREADAMSIKRNGESFLFHESIGVNFFSSAL